jgi:rare lipoprotein A
VRIVCLALLLVLSVSAGCGKKKTQIKLPPPPSNSVALVPGPEPPNSIESAPKRHGKQKWEQVGTASWYVPEPRGRKTASGEAYSYKALTAAHRTLPLQSQVRVTNLRTNKRAIVRINDRGPFINERVIDLSLAAAKALDVWRAGQATVKLELLYTPAAIDVGGRWCVQIGAFRQRKSALDLKQKLIRHYRQARVLDFRGSTGYWLRVRVRNDDRHLAHELAGKINVKEGGVFLVRLD